MLGFIGTWGGISLDDQANAISLLAQEALARPAPPPWKPIASTDDLALGIALDAAALIRGTLELAFNTANLEIAATWAAEGDTDADSAIATRLTMDTHTPIVTALGTARIAARIFLAHLAKMHPGWSVRADVAQSYDDIFRGAVSDMLRIQAATRSDTEAIALDPTLGPEASYLVGEIANIARSAAAEASEYSGGGLAPTFMDIGNAASVAADFAAKAAEANEAARVAMREENDPR